MVLKAYLNPLRERAARTEGGASGMVRQGRWLLLAPCEEQLVREGAQFVRRCVGKAEEKFILEMDCEIIQNDDFAGIYKPGTEEWIEIKFDRVTEARLWSLDEIVRKNSGRMV